MAMVSAAHVMQEKEYSGFKLSSQFFNRSNDCIVRCVPVLDSIHSPSGERVAQSSVYDSGISHHSEEDQSSSSLSSSLSSLEMTDERTEIILAATFLLIVVLSFVA